MLPWKIEGEQKVIYCVSKKFLEYEIRYTPLEKIVWALLWVTKKLKNYMLTYMVHVMAQMNPIRYLL